MTKVSGNETYTVKYLKNVTGKEIPALPAKVKNGSKSNKRASYS